MKALIIYLVLLGTAWSASEWEKATIPYPFYDVQTSSDNMILLLNRGEAALQARIDLIRRAKYTIEVEYFIFKTDVAGKIIARELIEAAKRGVKVRILVDNLGSELSSFHAKEFAAYGIEMKFYNTSSFIRLKRVNYRNHRKLLIGDDAEVITGGRNIGNDYYNLDDDYNYDDSDVLIEGPMVKTIRESFDSYYSDKLSDDIKFPKRPLPGPKGGHPGQRGGVDPVEQYERRTKSAKKFLLETDEEINTRQEIAEVANEQFKNLSYHTCPEMTFVTDAPSGDYLKKRKDGYLENFRHVMKVLDIKMKTVDKELTISTPYFIANERNKKVLNALLENKVAVNLYTNSLKASDAIYMATGFYSYLKTWLGRGMKVSLHDGKWQDMDVALKKVNNSRWGTHAKTQVYEWQNGDSEIKVGTYNMDNRSDYYNNELVVFCKGNNELTSEFKADITKRASKGIVVNSNDVATDRQGRRINILGTSGINKIKMYFAALPTWLFEHLL